MDCPNCHSARIRRASRHGLYEGLWLRLLHRAPYRCRDCRQRFIGRYRHHAAQHHGPANGLAAYLGLDDSEGGLAVTVTVAVLVLLTAFMIISSLLLLGEAVAPTHGHLPPPAHIAVQIAAQPGPPPA